MCSYCQQGLFNWKGSRMKKLPSPVFFCVGDRVSPSEKRRGTVGNFRWCGTREGVKRIVGAKIILHSVCMQHTHKVKLLPTCNRALWTKTMSEFNLLLTLNLSYYWGMWRPTRTETNKRPRHKTQKHAYSGT